ncbi:hypothetical protein J2S48_001218 [Promicromonospora iranensis]|uniref:Uncharacterized protein n=1 Tax=Promicromonospora iranensis TaxID=1105144 RepID=A0ABU2CK57_9MICO|nr:hypothetical protein [Promicromonospora iranensis]
MVAHAFLTVLPVVVNDAERVADGGSGMVAITLGEARRLFTRLLTRATTTLQHILSWSRWRLRHQRGARRAHYQRREGSITAAHRPNLRI